MSYERKVEVIEKVSSFPYTADWKYWIKCSYCQKVLLEVPTYSFMYDDEKQFVIFCRACANAFIPIPELKEMTPEIVNEIDIMMKSFNLVRINEMFMNAISKLFAANPALIANTIGNDLRQILKLQRETMGKKND